MCRSGISETAARQQQASQHSNFEWRQLRSRHVLSGAEALRYILVRTENDERTPLAIDITLIEDISRRVTPKCL
jgi:hypothetical protein